MKEMNDWILRWYLCLQPYSFQVLNRPDKADNADFFSRAGEEEDWEGDRAVETPTTVLRRRMCDGADRPRTGTERVNPSVLAKEDTPLRLCWACSDWKSGIKGCRAAQSV